MIMSYVCVASFRASYQNCTLQNRKLGMQQFTDIYKYVYIDHKI